MTRQATVRYYADWDTGYTWDSAGYYRWGSIDNHLPIGDNNAHTSFYQPIIHFPIDTSYMVSVISAQVVVQVCDSAVHFGSFWGGTPSWLIGRLSQSPPDHQNAATVCGGGGWATSVPAYSPGWDSVSEWPSHNNGWAYGIDATATVQALKAGYPNYGFMFAAYNPNLHRSEWRSNNSGATAYIDITYEVPNEAPTTPWIYSPGNASYGNNTTPLVALANSGDIDGDPGGGAVLQYGVVDAYGQESWQTQIGTSGFDSNPAQYIGHFYPTLTRGKWHCFRGIFWDHHGAYSPWSASIWHYVYAIPNAPSIVGGMQPIHNLGALAQWTGPEGQPTVRITPSDPDGNSQNRIEFEISDDQVTADWSGGYDGTYSNGVAYDFNIPYGLANDLDRYIRARTRDSQGNWGPWSSWVTIKVRWSQAIYQYNGGTASGQYAFSLGTLGGSSPSAATLFRGATGSGGAGAGNWKASIGEVGQPEWMNVLVRLAVGRNTSSPTTLTDMTMTFLGAAQQPDEWAFSGLDSDFWQLDTSNRRYGTKSLKWTRQTPVATGLQALAQTDTNGSPYVVPVVKNTEYTLSVWVRGTLSYGEMRGYVLRQGDPTPIIVAVTDPVTDTQGEWVRMRTTFRTDESTTDVCIGVSYDATADGLGDIFWVDAVQLEEGPVASVWNPGQTGAVIVDVGGIAIDASRGASLRLRGADNGLFDTVELGNKGLVFGDTWQVYSDGDKLLASDGTTTVGLAPFANQGCMFNMSGTVANGWNTINSFTSVTLDPQGMVNAGTGRVTIPYAGWWVVTGTIVWGASAAGAWRIVKANTASRAIFENRVPCTGQALDYHNEFGGAQYFNAGEVIYFSFYQDTGGNLSYYTGALINVAPLGVTGPAGPAGADGETIVNNIDVGNRSIGARAYSVGYQTLNNGAWPAVNFAATHHDTDGFFSASLPTRLTVPANCPSGIYHVRAQVRFEGHTSNRDIAVVFAKNGSWQDVAEARMDSINQPAGLWPTIQTTMDIWLNPGDYVEAYAFQYEGGSCYIGSSAGSGGNQFSITYVGSGSAAGTAVEGTEVSRSTAQSIGNGATAAISFDTEARDDLGAWAVSPEPTRLTVAATGWYKVSAGGYWGAPTTDWSKRQLYVQVGTAWSAQAVQEDWASGSATYQNVNDTLYLTAGDYIRLFVKNFDSAAKDFSGAYLRLVKMASGAESTLEVAPIEDAPGARFNVSGLSLPNATGVFVSGSSEAFDSHGFWSSGDPTKFVIPAGMGGRYRVDATLFFVSGGGGDYMLQGWFYKNGSAYGTEFTRTMPYGYQSVEPSTVIDLVPGDYIRVYLAQHSTFTQTAHGSITLTRLATSLQGETGPQGPAGTASATSGIAFPATQVPSSDPNTFDDYEEGDWSPVFAGASGGTGTMDSARTYGRYVKMGKRVWVEGYAYGTKGTVAGGVRISGLPFPTRNATYRYATFTVGWYSGIAGWVGGYVPMLYSDPNTSYINLVFMSNATTTTMGVVSDASLGAHNTAIMFSGFYETDN